MFAEGARKDEGMVGGIKDGFNAAWVHAANDGYANFHAVLFKSIKNWQQIVVSFGMKNDKARVQFDKIIDMLGWLSGDHVNIDRPAFRPPNGGFINSFIWREGTVRDIDVNSLGERIEQLYLLFVTCRRSFGDCWGDGCNCHVNPRLVFDFGVDIFRLGVANFARSYL